MKPISIQYDGRVTVSDYGSFVMGEQGLVQILKPYIGLEDGEVRDINASVNITIELKPAKPLVIGGEVQC